MYQSRVQAGKGGYAIKLNNNLYLDCYEKYIQNKCMASYANSPRNAFHGLTGEKAKANCRLMVDVNTRTAKLVCGPKRDTPNSFVVKSNTEFVWDYDDEYIFPEI